MRWGGIIAFYAFNLFERRVPICRFSGTRIKTIGTCRFKGWHVPSLFSLNVLSMERMVEMKEYPINDLHGIFKGVLKFELKVKVEVDEVELELVEQTEEEDKVGLCGGCYFLKGGKHGDRGCPVTASNKLMCMLNPVDKLVFKQVKG